jgi:hypothetical protein
VSLVLVALEDKNNIINWYNYNLKAYNITINKTYSIYNKVYNSIAYINLETTCHKLYLNSLFIAN